MWTAALSFIKGKVFSEAGSLVVPLVIILTIFCIWNSESILSKFGFETTSNLKAEVITLKAEVSRLAEDNAKLTEDLAKAEQKGGLAGDAVGVLCEKEKETENTIGSITDRRKAEAARIKKSLEENKEQPASPPLTALPPPELKVTAVASLEQTEVVVKTISSPPSSFSPAKNAKVEALSMNNIRALNEAYAELYKES